MVVLHDLHLLETFVSHVKANGGETESDDILAIDGQFISSLSLGIEGPLISAIKILRTLKDLHMTLNALREAVETGLSKAQKKLLPVTRHHGILSLPHEIIVRIFRQVYDDDVDCATQTIPLVNRYFRDIAIGMPELWTRLSSRRNPRLYMERSKPLGLEVDLTDEFHYRHFLDMVAPEVERWTSLLVPPRDLFDEEDFEWTRDVLAEKTFTALRELRIGDHFYSRPLKDVDPLYSDWKMPSLRIMKSNNTLPSIQPASLTCFHLNVGDPDSSWRCVDIDLNEITTFLQAWPLLSELSLDISWFDKVAFHTGTEATLLNVRTLRLRVKPSGRAEAVDSPLTDFLASLHTPNVSDLAVDVTVCVASQLIPWIYEIFPKGNSFWPSLETLDLSISHDLRGYGDYGERDGTSVPDDIFQRIPAVRHLTIRAVNVDPPCPTWNVQLPHLQTLCFRGCNKFDTRSVLGIRRIFEAPEFETLKTHNCMTVYTEFIREMMPEGKMFVSTVDWNEDISVL